MQVMHDRVLIKKIDPNTKTASGLLLTFVADEAFEATVIKVGIGKRTDEGLRIPLSVREGDRVIYNPNATTSVTVNGEKMLVIKEEDIFAVLDNAE